MRANLSILALAAMLASVSAQDAPQCFALCIRAKLSEVGSLAPSCSATDYACLCSTSTFTTAFTNCLNDNCANAGEVAAASTLGTNFCGTGAIPGVTTLSNGASATSTASASASSLESAASASASSLAASASAASSSLVASASSAAASVTSSASAQLASLSSAATGALSSLASVISSGASAVPRPTGTGAAASVVAGPAVAALVALGAGAALFA